MTLKPVDQTLFYDPAAGSRQRGNCWTACIASILERPIDEVPNFVQIDIDGGQNWFTHTWAWLQQQGYRLAEHSRYELATDVFVIATGVSPRGEGDLRHAVVFQRGSLAHDPHPSRDGLLTVERIYEVVPD